MKHKKINSNSRDKRYKFISEDGYVEAPTPPSLKEVIKFKEEEKERRRILRSKMSRIREQRNARNRSRGIEIIDWDDLEIITFNPKNPKHARHREILELNHQNTHRKKLVSRLETEFCRLYSRYRRAADRARGRVTVNYDVLPGERKYAAAAAVLCIQKGVTPRQVLEYWHEHIKNFDKAKSMVVPGLAFLSSPANIDAVACSVIVDGRSSPQKRRTTTEPLTRTKAGSSFSDTSDLDMRLRLKLEKAGFNTQNFNDRHLLTVQRTAMALAMGRDIFVGEGPIRDMSIWASENLYCHESGGGA